MTGINSYINVINNVVQIARYTTLQIETSYREQNCVTRKFLPKKLISFRYVDKQKSLLYQSHPFILHCITIKKRIKLNWDNRKILQY